MDNMLQLQILQHDTRGLFVPTSLQKLVIDAKAHAEAVEAASAGLEEGKIREYAPPRPATPTLQQITRMNLSVLILLHTLLKPYKENALYYIGF